MAKSPIKPPVEIITPKSPVKSGQDKFTIGQIFQSRGLWAWFSSRVTNYYDGQSERGQDYSTSFGTPVGVPVGGTIVRIVHNNNAINDVVELQDSSGAVWLYQHITAKVKVGDSLGVGGIIGTENGLPIDQYSTGPHIEVRYCPAGKWQLTIDSWNEPWINPKTIFAGLADQTAGQVDNGSGLSGAVTRLVNNVHIAPDASVGIFLASMDTALELRNPFTVNVTTGPQDFTILGIDTGIPNPGSDVAAVFSGTEQVFGNIVNDLSALIVRTAFISIGLVIIYAIGWKFVSGAIQGGINQVLEPVGGVQGATTLAKAFL